MASGPVELLSASFDLNGGIMSDSGILFCSNDIENLIINEIERIKGSKQRADTISVCKALYKKHGLAEGRGCYCHRFHDETWQAEKDFLCRTRIIQHP